MPTKLDYVQEKNLGPADDLRQKISHLEEMLSKISQLTSSQGVAALCNLDEIMVMLNQLEAVGLDVRPEQGRVQAIQGRLQKNAARLLTVVGGPAVLSQQRPSPPPLPEQWWWYIDQQVAAARQHLVRRVGWGAVIVFLLVIGLVVLFNTVLAPSPETVARLKAENGAYAAADQGDYRLALTAINEGLTQSPNDSFLLMFKGVLYQLLKEDQIAAQSFALAQQKLNNPKEFYLGRGQLYLRLNQIDLAEPDIEAALKLDNRFARTWLLKGQMFESRGQSRDALQAYEEAGRLALDQGEDEIYVLSRMSIVRLGQMSPSFSPLSTPESK
jgi:Tfp pilus assembly protein PilF